MTFLRIYLAVCRGVPALLRCSASVNAVISPELSRDLSLNPSSLGLLTSAYFLAFGAAQLPVGMLLDRYGPRRVEPVLLAVAAAGALLSPMRKRCRDWRGARRDRRSVSARA